MTVFDSAGKLCFWAGLVLTNNESAGRKYSTRISKGGRYLKPFLVQIANAVGKSDKYSELRNKYLKLKKRRGYRKAIIAIAEDYWFLCTKCYENKKTTIIFYKG